VGSTVVARRRPAIGQDRGIGDKTRGDGTVAGETQPRAQPAGELAAPSDRFGLLLLLLLGTYLLSAFTGGRWVDAVQILLVTVVAILALRNSSAPRRTLRLIAVTAIAGSAAAAIASLTSTTGAGIAHIWTGLVLLFAVVMIVLRVLSFGTVTIQSIYGALSAYLVIGLMFASFYAAINDLAQGDFFANNQPAITQTFQYFSFTTLTTLGYGDFTAISNGGRAVAILEALTGQVFLATLVARLVAAYRGPRDREG
jgi:Ion channel